MLVLLDNKADVDELVSLANSVHCILFRILIGRKLTWNNKKIAENFFRINVFLEEKWKLFFGLSLFAFVFTTLSLFQIRVFFYLFALDIWHIGDNKENDHKEMKANIGKFEMETFFWVEKQMRKVCKILLFEL